MKKSDTYIKYIMLYGCYYFASAMFSVLISVYLMDKGLSAVRVSLIVSASCIMSMLVQPIIGMLQDKGDKKRITVALLIMAAATGILFVLNDSLAWLLLFYGITITLLNAANPYIEKIATISRFSYRSIRIWGTIGYGIGSQIAGVVYDYLSPESMYYFFAASILLAAVGVFGARGIDAAAGVEEKAAAKEKTEYRKAVLTNRVLLFYILIAAMFYATTNLNSTYIPALYQQAGISASATTTVLFIGTLMELPVIFFVSAYMNRFTSKQLLSISFAVLIVQFAVYALAPWVTLKIAATVLLKSSVTMAYIMLNLKVVSAVVSPAYQMSALTLVSAISRNLITVVIQNIGGAVLDALSINTLCLILAALAALGLLMTAAIRIPRAETETTF